MQEFSTLPDDPGSWPASKSMPNQASAAQRQLELMEQLIAQQQQIQRLLQAQSGQNTNSVRVIDFNMPFFALVGMLIKFAFASIPAAIVLWIVMGVLGGIILFALSALGGIGSLLLG